MLNSATVMNKAIRPATATEIPKDLPLMLTAEDCAAIAGVTPKCIRDQLRRGKIKGVQVGNAWRVHRDAFLHDYMQF